MQSALNEFVRPISVEDKENAPAFTPKDGTIKFNHVAFHYDSGHQVFKNFSLEIPSSQKIGVVGLSGAGKTTLCQLLLRNYDLQGGEIIIGNQNIADVTQSSLRKNIAVIPQDPTLFHRSLYENILYGKPEATKDEVIAASIAAQAHDFILSTPEGYETTVGERGVKLSGGQRQRIAIARAILKNAPILILDEATSALDSDTERLIQSALNHAMEGRTTIVVAHRLSTLAHLDRIIVMKDGMIIEDSNLQALIEANGHFAYLWNLQAGGFLPEKL
jgi:ATP-binding cassette subfamily B protein